MDQEPGGVAVNVSDRREQSGDLVGGGALAQGHRRSGSEGLDGPQIVLENLAVEEQQGIEGLVLGGGGCPLCGEAGEEGFDLQFWAGGGELVGFQKQPKTAQPVGVGFLGADREVFSITNSTQQEDCIRNVHAVIYEPRLYNDSWQMSVRALHSL
jgi:hypothetical protein